jgi:D-aminopeptidase
MPRAADLGIRIGLLPPGPTNSVLDVAGVGVGHATVHREEPEPPDGRGTARTGVTVLRLADDTFDRPLMAGGAVLNGAGECTGFITAAEWGSVETPICLTSTLQLGRVYDAACELMLEEEPRVAEEFIIPVVAECDDSFLNDARRMQVSADDVWAAWAAARASASYLGGPPEEGAVGAGTGMSCLGFKGGIGTASRVTPDGHTVGVLLLTNFGERDRLTVDGVPVGRLLRGFGTDPPSPGTEDRSQTGGPPKPPGKAPPAGSCIGIVVTDAAVNGASCARLARRVGLGLARTGSVAHHGSGEIFLAATTGLRTDRRGAPLGAATVAGYGLNPLFEAVVEASEEAVLNSMLMATTTVGRAGHRSVGLPADDVVRLLREHGRLA